MSQMEHVSSALQLGAVPAAFMALFTLIGLGKEVPPKIAGALQHFAAGILLCTIGTELLPDMVQAEGLKENVAAAVGFFLGVAALIILGMFMPEEEEDDDDYDDDSSEGVGGEDVVDMRTGGHRLSLFDPAPHAARKRGRQSLIAAARQINARNSTISVSANSSVASTKNETSPLLSSAAKEDAADTATSRNGNNNSNPFPMTLLSAIAIDSAMDGLLIGIATVAGPSAGPMMSLSLTVEMSFLGLTLATALNGHANYKSYPASFLGPGVLVLGAGAGGFLASSLLQHPAMFTGLLSFGTSALLFMVAEELLLEAHEDGADHVWWVDLQLYVGFYASIMLGKFVPSE